MNLARKLEYVTQGIRNIGTHEDEDSVVRLAALDQIDQAVLAERERIAAAVKAEIASAIAPGGPTASRPATTTS